MVAERTTAPAPAPAAAGHLLHLIRSSQARTRRDLVDSTGLSRSTVAARLDQLMAAGYIRESTVPTGARGRPTTTLAFDETHGGVLAADLGATHARAALCNLSGERLGEVAQNLRISSGPDTVLDWIEHQWRRLVAESDLPAGQVLGLSVGVPGPVDVSTGRLVRPPIMPGWHDYPVRERLEQSFGVPGFIENDADVMAFGEYHADPAIDHSLLLVKVATGIGAGMVVDGRLVRGYNGGAGDLGHVRITDPESGPLCACGARGCLAASVSGGALARRLRDAGRAVATSRDVLRLAQAGNADAIGLIREAGLLIGEVLATAVSLLNPQVLVIGGDLVQAPEHFMVGLRERLYQRTQPLATRDLRVVPSTLGDRAGVVGAARLAVEEVFAPDAVDRRLAGHVWTNAAG